MSEPSPLVGIGLYTPAEAGRLLAMSPARIGRWLRGYDAAGTRYDALWAPQVDLGDRGIFLGFRDLMEVRVAAEFMRRGLSPQRVRKAIGLARNILGEERPLSTTRFKTDGRTVFLHVVEDGDATLMDLFSSQYAFEEVLSRSLKNIDYTEEGNPLRWWPVGRSRSIVVDPDRSFGQPIEAETSVPTAALAAAARAEGSAKAAARVWSVPVRSVKRAVAFQDMLDERWAA